jgi:NADH:ubiquinone oxidoreductase subunit 2 (subunit N)
MFILTVLVVSFNYTGFIEVLMVFTLLLKLGAAPLHGWFLSLVKTVNIYVLFLLSTVQKIIPLIIIRILNYWVGLVFFVSILSFMLILLMGLRLLRFFKILALSRINNLVWILIRILRGFQYLIFYFFIYT